MFRFDVPGGPRPGRSVTCARMSKVPVRVDDHGAIRVITLDRPEARNALSLALLGALTEALDAADADDAVHVVVLTGTDPAFCAGLDLKEAANDPAFFEQFTSRDAISKVPTMDTPIIGAVNGATFTGGLELALGCDFLVASERAYFGDTHARVGVLPGGGLTARLPQAIGLRRALQMSFTSEIVDAHRAERIGLVNEVVPHEQLLPRALEVAEAVTVADPAIVRALKAMYIDASRETLAGALDIERARSRGWSIDLAGLGARRDRTMAANRASRANRPKS
jgi:enoyl-CoA hydratase